MAPPWLHAVSHPQVRIFAVHAQRPATCRPCQSDGAGEDDMVQSSSRNNRTHFEEWMVNLRGEHEWLSSARKEDWYTGKHPSHGVCPGVSADGRIHSLPMPNLHKVTRKQAQDYFDNSWTMTEVLFAGFRGDEAFFRPPVHGQLPLKTQLTKCT